MTKLHFILEDVGRVSFSCFYFFLWGCICKEGTSLSHIYLDYFIWTILCSSWHQQRILKSKNLNKVNLYCLHMNRMNTKGFSANYRRWIFGKKWCRQQPWLLFLVASNRQILRFTGLYCFATSSSWQLSCADIKSNIWSAIDTFPSR